MRIHDTLRVRGEVTFRVFDGDLDEYDLERLLAGKETRPALLVVRRNLVTNVGRKEMVKPWTGTAITAPNYIAFGSTVIAPAPTDTVLAGEFFRKVCSSATVYQDYYGRWVMNSLTTDFNTTVTGNIKGAGLFTASAAGNMWAIVTADVAKTSTQSLVTEWKVLQLGV